MEGINEIRDGDLVGQLSSQGLESAADLPTFNQADDGVRNCNTSIVAERISAALTGMRSMVEETCHGPYRGPVATPAAMTMSAEHTDDPPSSHMTAAVRLPSDVAASQQKQPAAMVALLLPQINLLSIAQSGDAHLLQQLHELDALGSLTDINKVHPFKAPALPIPHNMTVLLIASCLGHTAVVQVLLKVPGVDVNLLYGQKCGDTALMMASYHGRTATVQALLADARVEVNLTGVIGHTALMLAIFKVHAAVVQALLADARVDVDIKDMGGRTALDYAKEYRRADIIRLLEPKRNRSIWRWWG